LVARAYDTEAQVLEALYGSSSLVNSVLAKHSILYLDGLESSLCNTASKPARPVLRIHLAYLISHFCPAVDVHTQYEAFLRIVFPFLLFSKPRHRATEAVWDIIAASMDPGYNVPGFELLSGCAEIWRTEKSKQDTIDLEAMGRLNMTLASRIAGEPLSP
jgi:U3 small nucleolar RNA-associated protein 10